MQVLIGGDIDGADALAKALTGRGIDAEVASGTGAEPAQALVALERVLEAAHPPVAVAIGCGTTALAMAITAAKLGIPTAASLQAAPGREDERRIVASLASQDIGPVNDEDRAAEAAARLVAWAHLD